MLLSEACRGGHWVVLSPLSVTNKKPTSTGQTRKFSAGAHLFTTHIRGENLCFPLNVLPCQENRLLRTCCSCAVSPGGSVRNVWTRSVGYSSLCLCGCCVFVAIAVQCMTVSQYRSTQVFTCVLC